LETIRIRPYQEADFLHLEALEATVQPYLPGDEAAVEAMFLRAESAQQGNDPRWMAIPILPPRTIAEEFNAFWVAEDTADNSIVGIVGAQEFHLDEILPHTHELSQKWRNTAEVIELRRLRVASEARRRGVGKSLSQVVIDWSREHRYKTLIVNTTTPQAPALALYRSLGFQDAGISYIGKYEMRWLEITL